MIKQIASILFLTILLTSCGSETQQNPFEISKQHVGLLTDSTQVKDLKLVFPNDSIVKPSKGDKFASGSKDIKVLDKTGKELLLLTPSKVSDSTATIKTVLIQNSEYKTQKNISSISTFSDIKNAYKISKISNLISSVVVTVNEINASFTIDKKELPANLRFNMDLNIEAVQIPDNAKIKYFILHW